MNNNDAVTCRTCIYFQPKDYWCVYSDVYVSDELDACYSFYTPISNPDVKNIEEKKKPMVLYLCDRRACETCGPSCSYVKNISHARNFEKTPSGHYMEKEKPLALQKSDINAIASQLYSRSEALQTNHISHVTNPLPSQELLYSEILEALFSGPTGYINVNDTADRVLKAIVECIENSQEKHSI